MIKHFQNTKYVILTLENCDEIAIDINDIETLMIDDVVETNHFQNDFSNKIFSQQKIAKFVHLVLKPSANKTHHQFYGALKQHDDFKESVFDRITNHHDICQIRLEDKNHNEIDYFLVEYVEANEGVLGSPNINQKTRIIKDWKSNNKLCEITIKKWHKNHGKKRIN